MGHHCKSRITKMQKDYEDRARVNLELKYLKEEAKDLTKINKTLPKELQSELDQLEKVVYFP
jgi:hypothetical protein